LGAPAPCRCPCVIMSSPFFKRLRNTDIITRSDQIWEQMGRHERNGDCKHPEFEFWGWHIHSCRRKKTRLDRNGSQKRLTGPFIENTRTKPAGLAIRRCLAWGPWGGPTAWTTYRTPWAASAPAAACTPPRGPSIPGCPHPERVGSDSIPPN